MRILNEGERLAGRYTLRRRLGSGGMSEVWLADDRQTQSRVALKFLPGESAADPAKKSLLNREWRIGSRLMHANIVRVFEFHDDPEGTYYTLQYVGETDLSVLAGKGLEEALRPVGLIADALRYAHGKGVIHRDIKASNILLDSRGIPYLVDFGVASAPGHAALVGGGSDVATSPQQAAGDSAIAADDIYALGVTMHELLTGLPPGPQGNAPGSLVLPDGRPVPRAVCELLADMLADDVARRPDAATVAERLLAAGIVPGPAPPRFVRGALALDEVVESVAAAPAFSRSPGSQPGLNEPSGKASGIPPAVLFGGLAIALILFLGVIFVLPELAQNETPAVSEAPVVQALPVDTSGGVEDEEPANVPPSLAPAPSGSGASFNENLDDTDASNAALEKAATDEALGDLLSQLERLRYRAIERWGGQEYLDAVDVYAEGDRAYVGRNYRLAGERYRAASKMLDPFFDRIDGVFKETLAAAIAAFDAGDHSEAVRLYDLATSVTPGNREAEAGLIRAQNLQAVLSLMEQAARFEADLELDAAKLAFEKALALDAQWTPARTGLARVNAAIKQLSFEQRMTEGFEALAAGEFDSARAAFNAAKALDASSSQPTDGLLQLDQEVRLSEIRRLEQEAATYKSAEQWETSLAIYEDILKIDPDLQFAQQGLAEARSRSALHARLSAFIDDPDTLSDQVVMQNATKMLLDITRMQPMGPRLEDQKNELSRLLKRAATPLPVRLVSDNLTNVAIFKIGELGAFSHHELDLRPGNYVAVGIRPGYRDVRVEFRVAPEIRMEPIVVQCEEQI